MIYFVRHGQTDYNKEERTQGRLDIPLNSVGIKQAKSVANKLKKVKIDYIFCSPLVRATKTANIINYYHNLPITIDERLIHYNAGTLQGKINSPETYNNFYKNPHLFNGESVEEVYARVCSFFEDISNLKGKNILIVSHASVGSICHYYFRKEKPNSDTYQKVKLKNAKITQFDF